MIATGLNDFGSLLGYLGAALSLAAFSMRTMIALRAVAISGHATLLLYGLYEQLYPILVLHAILLPVNLVRLIGGVRRQRAIERANQAPVSVEPLIPHMLELHRPRGAVLFEAGERAEILYYIAEGTVRIVGIENRCGPGDLIGEIALFAADRRRTATAICETDCRLYAITGSKVMSLFMENPEFGLTIARLVTARLLERLNAAEARDRHPVAH